MDGDMEADLRAYLDERFGNVNSNINRIEGQVQGLTNALQAHSLESAVRYERVENKADKANARLDTHKNEHILASEADKAAAQESAAATRWIIGLLVTVILAVIGIVVKIAWGS